jgi:hypothetical protein
LGLRENDLDWMKLRPGLRKVDVNCRINLEGFREDLKKG